LLLPFPPAFLSPFFFAGKAWRLAGAFLFLTPLVCAIKFLPSSSVPRNTKGTKKHGADQATLEEGKNFIAHTKGVKKRKAPAERHALPAKKKGDKKAGGKGKSKKAAEEKKEA